SPRPHDRARDADRHAADEPGPRRRRRAERSAGPGRHRRSDGRDVLHALLRPGDLQCAAPQASQGLRRGGSAMSAPRVRGRTMVLAGIGALGVFLVLFAVGVVPRLRNSRELATAAEQLRTTPLNLYVVRPERASAADLTLAATTQAIQDSIIYARISGYLIRRHVDIGDRVTAGQLLAEVDSPEVDEQLRQARAELQQSEKALDLQRANLDLGRATMAGYEAADAEGAVPKQ